MTRAEALAIAVQVSKAVIETVNESPQGAPAGPMYAAFMARGMSLETFEAITGALVDAGRIRRVGHVFYPPLPATTRHVNHNAPESRS
jgi:hypothetical protein